MVQIIQQREKCIGCNACVEAADYRWRVSRRDGKCTLVNGVDKRGFYRVMVDDHEYEDNLQAARNCPVKIIQVQKI
ncbi:MAG TPA: ferredoxin [Saprospiraceae bacterium]|nr:ferredoxin [Saprospiraceae bacterium]